MPFDVDVGVVFEEDEPFQFNQVSPPAVPFEFDVVPPAPPLPIL
jgi:hypothetical protein